MIVQELGRLEGSLSSLVFLCSGTGPLWTGLDKWGWMCIGNPDLTLVNWGILYLFLFGRRNSCKWVLCKGPTGLQEKSSKGFIDEGSFQWLVWWASIKIPTICTKLELEDLLHKDTQLTRRSPHDWKLYTRSVRLCTLPNHGDRRCIEVFRTKSVSAEGTIGTDKGLYLLF